MQSLGRGRYKGGAILTPGGLQYSGPITVSSAELLALRATPKTLLPACPSGSMYAFAHAIAVADNGTAYVVGTNDLAIRYKDGSGDVISQTIDTAGLLDQTTDIMSFVGPIATDSKTPKADCDGQALVLHNTGASEFTTGTGVLRMHVWYHIIPTGW
jgi:hypothetical protein